MTNCIKVQSNLANTVVQKDGSIYEGEFEDGLPCGYGIMIWSEKDLYHKYEGEWKNGLMHGKGCLKFKTGHTYEGTFINGFWSYIRGNFY